jgi:hypothetical protein
MNKLSTRHGFSFKTPRALLLCGVLAVLSGFSTGSQAAVVYSGILNQSGTLFHVFLPPFEGMDFTFDGVANTIQAVYSADAIMVPIHWGTVAQNLAFGTVIDQSVGYWTSANGAGVSLASIGVGTTGYIGFTDGGRRNGWVQIQNQGGNVLNVIDYAFQHDGFVTITAGQTDNGPAVPEPSSVVLMLSVMAVGLPLYRRYRKTGHAS